MINPQVLQSLCCPETRQPLRYATAEELAAANRLIDASALKDAGGETVATRVTEALIRENGSALYPMREGIPILLAGEALVLRAPDHLS